MTLELMKYSKLTHAYLLMVTINLINAYFNIDNINQIDK